VKPVTADDECPFVCLSFQAITFDKLEIFD
jgi:hypothetical protein